MNNPTVEPKVIRAGEGQPLQLRGEVIRPILSSADTDGAVAFFHSHVTAGNGAPPHVHSREDEFFFIESGEFTFRVGEGHHVMRKGDFVFAPRFVPHSYICQSEEGSFYAGFINAGVENFFHDMAQSMEKGELSFANILESGTPYGLHFDGFESLEAPVMTAHILRADEGDLMHAYGDSLRTLVATPQTKQQFCVVIDETPAQSGPPPHLHEKEAEIFLILEGRYEHLTEDMKVQSGPGDVIFLPPNQKHCFRVVSEEPGRAMIIAFPGGFDLFFHESAQMFADGSANPQSLGEMAATHGIRFFPPFE